VTNHIFGLGIVLNGASVIGVLIVLGATLVHAFADDLPATFRTEIAFPKTRTALTS
jgi:hypothetical protein